MRFGLTYFIIGYIVSALLHSNFDLNPFTNHWLDPMLWLHWGLWPLFLLFAILAYGIMFLIIAVIVVVVSVFLISKVDAVMKWFSSPKKRR